VRVNLLPKLQSRKSDVSNSFLDEAGSLNLSAGSIIGFAIGLIVLAAVVPDAIGTFYSTNTSAWAVNGIEDTKNDRSLVVNSAGNCRCSSYDDLQE